MNFKQYKQRVITVNKKREDIDAKKIYVLSFGLKASNQTRTDDPFITSEVLYQLSYRSIFCRLRNKTILSYFYAIFKYFFTSLPKITGS